MSPEGSPPTTPAPSHLFPPLRPEMTTALAAYPSLLRRVLHLKPGQERELAWRIRELSLSLTAEREGGPKPGYLSDPRSLSAYAWYFLPWNLLRLARLLPGLDMVIPQDGLVCDLGAGPLTFLQALWLARPELRAKRLRVLCVDRSKRALDLGLALFAGLAGFDPTSSTAPWRVRIVRGEYWQGLTEGASLVAMVNVANELAEAGREPLETRMERLAAQLADVLAPGGQVLLVEPGTRLGFRCLAGVRQAFVEMGLAVTAPCPHDRPCPFAANRVRAWCHFNMSLSGAPAWLSRLSERAELGKRRLSLSFLMARAGEPALPQEGIRVVSGAFSLADTPGSAVYGCSGQGLTVLVAPSGQTPRPGDLLQLPVPAQAPRDPKSGAPRVLLAQDQADLAEPVAPGPARGTDKAVPAGRDERAQRQPGEARPFAGKPPRSQRNRPPRPRDAQESAHPAPGKASPPVPRLGKAKTPSGRPPRKRSAR